MTTPAPRSVAPRRTVPHGGTEVRRRLAAAPPPPPSPRPATRWQPPAWPLHAVVAVLLIGALRLAAEGHAEQRATAPPAVGAVEQTAARAGPDCAPRTVTRGSIRFQAPPIC